MFRALLCPSSGAQEYLYRWLLLVVLGALVFKLSVWCVAVGYVSGLRDYAHHQELKSIIQMVAACGTFFAIKTRLLHLVGLLFLRSNYSPL
jgi:hypothetical protein